MDIDEKNLAFYLKLNKLNLKKSFSDKMSEYVADKITIRNVLSLFQISSIFELSNISIQTFNCIERCFTILAETPQFLDLEYIVVAKVLLSSELHITSEREVFNAANDWLGYNIQQRSKFAKALLQKVRVPLLSNHAINYILNKTSFFTAIDECVAIIKEALDSKGSHIHNKSCVSYTNRFCNQNKFNIYYCGGQTKRGLKIVKTVYEVDGSNLTSQFKVLPPMIKERLYAKAVCLKGEIYVFRGGVFVDNKFTTIRSVDKYSHFTKNWNAIADIYDGRAGFCVSAFMDKIFIIGGINYGVNTNSCLQFDTKAKSWTEIAKMKEVRYHAACAVFEENVIVAGGWDINENDLRSVECYDVIADEWSPMPNMIESKCGHSLVVVKNKLFVIGRGTKINEVYDKNCKKFVALKSPQIFPSRNFVGMRSQSEIYLWLNKAISIGSKIYAVQDFKSSIFCYDVDKDEWTVDQCDIVNKNLGRFACVKVPMF